MTAVNQQNGNLFDDLRINVDDVFSKFSIEQKDRTSQANRQLFAKLYHSPLLPIKFRNYLWYGFHRTGLDQGWFEEFSKYWSEVLGARPLWGVHDFYFLRNWYRIKFQNNQLDDTNDTNKHLSAWQEPAVIYQLFQQVYKESLTNKLWQLGLMKKYHPTPAKSIVEYGCATAPITATALDLLPHSKRIVFTVADIKSLSFHYGAYRFRHLNNVTPLLLEPARDFLPEFSRPVDTIFCETVFEHLNKPLETVKIFNQNLAPGGLLLFDYVRGDGNGLDTLQAVKERSAVLDYIAENFYIRYGKLSYDKSVSLTVAQKK